MITPRASITAGSNSDWAMAALKPACAAAGRVEPAASRAVPVSNPGSSTASRALIRAAMAALPSTAPT